MPIAANERELGTFDLVSFRDGTRVYLTDPMGRRVGFTFDPQPGAVARIAYEYSAVGDLIRATNADGESSEMMYVAGRDHFLEQVLSTCGCFPLIRTEFDDDGRWSRRVASCWPSGALFTTPSIGGSLSPMAHRRRGTSTTATTFGWT